MLVSSVRVQKLFVQTEIVLFSAKDNLSSWVESLSFPQRGFKPVDVPGHMPASVTSGWTLTQTHPAACFFSLVQSSRSVKRKTWRSFLEPSTSSTIKRSLRSWRFCQRKQGISVYKAWHISTSIPILLQSKQWHTTGGAESTPSNLGLTLLLSLKRFHII